LDKMFPKFLEGCKNHGHDEEIAKKIWSDWEAFASYAFNKSHATCYAYIAFQTAFLKAHYPAAYMAAVLNHNKNDISKIDFYLQDTKRMGIKVLGPDINESNSKFTVNSKGQIRFGLSALKGVGEGPVDEIVNQRRQKGPFQDVYDMMRRLNLRAVNKKCMDSLVLGGAFDSFENIYRAQYFEPDDKNDTFIESLLRYGANFQAQRDSNQLSLFGDSMTNYIETPKPSNVPEWNLIDKLEKEKEVTGIYISGHPLDDYHLEFKNFINCSLDKVDDVIGSTLKLGGIVTDVVHAVNQKGNGYGRFTIQDFVGSTTLSVFNEQYLNFKHLLEKGNVIYVEGMNEKGYNSDRYFFRVKNIKMLDTVGTMLTKSITLKLSLDQITEVIAQKIETLCISHPGPHGFKIKLVDADLDIELDLLSSSHKVKVDNELVNELSNLQIPYKIN
ncbi:MAG: DNA polymerase III subunit alpha, partial [Saprospiraceae bacterium]|nr:DNA polymerase III subunit alpha [Saprospiraceae bacterium]